MDLMPTTREIKKWLLEVLKHSFHVEYYLNKLDIGKTDPERPHDIIGVGNKFSWPVIKGLALQYREKGKKFFEKQILGARDIHRKQYHHQMWNSPPKDANFDELGTGAIDTLCANLEDRIYQGGAKKFYELPKIIKKNKNSYKYTWLNIAYDLMKELHEKAPPKLEEINSLVNIPNIGIPDRLYQKTKRRLSETIEILQDKYGYFNSDYDLLYKNY